MNTPESVMHWSLAETHCTSCIRIIEIVRVERRERWRAESAQRDADSVRTGGTPMLSSMPS